MTDQVGGEAASPVAAVTVERGTTERAQGTGLGRHRCTVLWIALSAGTVLALCRTDFLPFYDYYQWLFQGHVVAVLLFGARAEAGFTPGSYVLSPVPVPNLAAPVLIGLLNTVLPIEVAGTVFLVVTTLGFAVAYGHLVRTVQQRPTPVEFLGFRGPWGSSSTRATSATSSASRSCSSSSLCSTG
jgi:hypothetical protein